MFQGFETTADPAHGAARLAALRAEMKAEGLAAFIVPRADVYQGEYVAECDARLAWLTGFTGSAGFCIVLRDEAGVFIDGRYRSQVSDQVDLAQFTPVNWPETTAGDWLAARLNTGNRVGIDPWLHTTREVEAIDKALAKVGAGVHPVANLVDRIWTDRPAPPAEAISEQPIELTGVSAQEKCQIIARTLRDDGDEAVVITLPDSVCWLLNVRGRDIAHNPVVQAMAILTESGHVTVFTEDRDLGPLAEMDAVTVTGPKAFPAALQGLSGPVRVDRTSAPHAVGQLLAEKGIPVHWEADPCALPKARKTEAELNGTRAAHLRDAAAVVEFLHWYDATLPESELTEIDLVTELEGFRRATNALEDISFETISGTGPHGAVIHYRVTRETNRQLAKGDLVVLDSGGQYRDGTTDITRTLPVGDVDADERAAFTRVLKGMIAISRARFPRGVTGAHLDALARYPLWLAGMDYDHGTGHGVGSYLSVHEGPQRLSRLSDVPLEPGMILSNEPGYYRDGAFGIRIENLIAVREADRLPGGDDRDFLCFETLTYVPIDRRLILPDMLDAGERAWLDAYHRACLDKLGSKVTGAARLWLARACAPL
ncbi:aminopeptidase P family protein [Maritimibacter sp. DP1N21-5]|uniref:aminopeptidase P family protein n=1 Tax=Maritimibacter sp. DP1N21-5 TaxID=2836867 RepID=UPI001C48FB4E|nr:aminopeptidase P family protein [Maritimibacter sp. DP1N21-5]MBV7409382.1 aminopeptidase P family protein [Maritimibacter sp. DP1N21-5]